jgi:hypothetical protein
MVLENNSGLMEQSTLESGERTELTGRGNSFMWMEISMTVSGLMIRPTAMVCINMLTVHNMKVNGRMIFNTVRE